MILLIVYLVQKERFSAVVGGIHLNLRNTFPVSISHLTLRLNRQASLDFHLSSLRLPPWMTPTSAKR